MGLFLLRYNFADYFVQDSFVFDCFVQIRAADMLHNRNETFQNFRETSIR